MMVCYRGLGSTMVEVLCQIDATLWLQLAVAALPLAWRITINVYCPQIACILSTERRSGVLPGLKRENGLDPC